MSSRFAAPRVAVIGATGCVGRHTCTAFADAGYEVVAVARRYTPDMADIRFHAMDVATLSATAIADFLSGERIEVVVNAAGTWSQNEADMHRAHVTLVEHLTAGVAAAPNRPRLIHMGTIHEYGPVPHGTAIDESVSPNPRTAYARTKLAGSSLVLHATAAGDIDGVVLRVVNVFGPDPTPASFLGSLSRKLRHTQPVELTITDAQRDYVDVRDAAQAAVLAATAPVIGHAINIGRGEALDLRTLVHAMAAAAGLPAEAIHERPGAVESKGGTWTQADTTRANKLLGWTAQHTLTDSIQAMLKTAPEPAAALD